MVPGTGNTYQVSATRYLVPGTWVLEPGTWQESGIPDTRLQLPSKLYQVLVLGALVRLSGAWYVVTGNCQNITYTHFVMVWDMLCFQETLLSLRVGPVSIMRLEIRAYTSKDRAGTKGHFSRDKSVG